MTLAASCCWCCTRAVGSARDQVSWVFGPFFRRRRTSATEHSPLKGHTHFHADNFHSLRGASESLHMRRALIVTSAYLAVGTAVFVRLEGLSWRDSFYFCCTMLTTVGYGDIAPHTAWGKLAVMFFVVFGVSIIASAIGALVGRAINLAHEHEPTPLRTKFWRLAAMTLLVVAVISVGAVWSVFMEGYTVLDGYYWALVTSCTVGFGELPMNSDTRTFNCFYLLISVTTVAFALGRMVELIVAWELELRVQAFVKQGVSKALIQEIDTDRVRLAARKRAIARTTANGKPGLCLSRMPAVPSAGWLGHAARVPQLHARPHRENRPR